jgi:hypothetical protein
MDPPLRRALALGAPGALPLGVPRRRAGQPLRRRDRLRRSAARAGHIVAPGQWARQEDGHPRHGRSRGGPGQPRRRDPRVFRVRLRPPRAVPDGHPVQGSAWRPGGLPGQRRRRLSDRPCAHRDRRTRQHPGPVAPARDVPSRDGRDHVCLRGVDDPEPAVRLELPSEPAIEPLQADQGAPARALRPHRRSGGGNEHLRTAARGGARPHAEARPSRRRDQSRSAGAGDGQPGQGDARAPVRARIHRGSRHAEDTRRVANARRSQGQAGDLLGRPAGGRADHQGRLRRRRARPGVGAARRAADVTGPPDAGHRVFRAGPEKGSQGPVRPRLEGRSPERPGPDRNGQPPRGGRPDRRGHRALQAHAVPGRAEQPGPHAPRRDVRRPEAARRRPASLREGGGDPAEADPEPSQPRRRPTVSAGSAGPLWTLRHQLWIVPSSFRFTGRYARA